MIDNTALLMELLKSGMIRMQRAGMDLLMNMANPYIKLPDVTRIRGMLLGVAIGDILGNPTESMNPADRKRAYGEITDFSRNSMHGTEEALRVTDDTQMTMLTLQSMLQKGGSSLLADIILGIFITHNDSVAISSGLAFAPMLRELLYDEGEPPQSWWRDRFLQIATCIETADLYAQRPPGTSDPTLPLSGWVRCFLGDETPSFASTREACDTWYSGAYLPETMPSVLYILGKYSNDPQRAVIRAVNDTRDNDTIAAIVGSAVGALHGEYGFPQVWNHAASDLAVPGCREKPSVMFQMLDQFMQRA